MAEVRSVLEKLNSSERAIVQPASEAYYRKDLDQLKALATEIPLLAKGKRIYADRPRTTSDELANSVLYRTRGGTWYRVTSDGKVFEGAATKEWALREDLSTKEGAKPDAPGILFRKIIFTDLGYQPPSLREPRRGDGL